MSDSLIIPNNAENQMLIATGMSQSLLYTLTRQYLNYPVTELSKPKFLTCKKNINLKIPSLLRLDKIGKNIQSTPFDMLASLQTVLNIFHNPGNCQLIFLILSDGRMNEIYLGVNSLNSSFDSNEFVEEYLGHWIKGNLSGTETSFYSNDTYSIASVNQLSAIEQQLSKFKGGTAITGLPSIPSQNKNGYPVSLDKLISGLRGQKYAYIVIADPISEQRLDPLLFSCREMQSQAEMINSISMSNSEQENISFGLSNTNSLTKSYGTSSANSKRNKMPLLAAGIGLAASALFAPAVFVSLLSAAAQYPILLSAGIGTTMGMMSNNTDSSQESQGETVGSTETVNYGSSSGKTISMSYVNKHVQAMSRYLSYYENRFEQSKAIGGWNVGTYILTEHQAQANFAASQLKALISGNQSMYDPVRLHPLNWHWNAGAKEALVKLNMPDITLAVDGEMLSHPFGAIYSGLTTPMNTDELALLVNIPQKSVAGIDVSQVASFSLPKEKNTTDYAMIGNVVDEGNVTDIKYSISIKDLSKHTLVSGINGSGKSHTTKKILEEMSAADIPFLVIEPAKDEYVSWAMDYNAKNNKSINIFMPGIESYRNKKLENTLKLNPFDIIMLNNEHPPSVLSHIDRLKSILIAALPMQEVLPILLEELLYFVYSLADNNWLGTDKNYNDLIIPTMEIARNCIDPLLQGKGYEQRIRSNISTALKSRLDNFLRGWKRDLFNPSKGKSTDWQLLFDKPTVINLSRLGDQADRAFTMSLILLFLYEYRQLQADASLIKLNESGLNHLTVIEEAHRVMPHIGSRGDSSNNSQFMASDMFANMLSEIRAYGEGLMICEQIPSRLVQDAIKNTNLKIIHRTVSGEDKNILSSCLDLNSAQGAMLSKLGTGEAVICGADDNEAVWVKIKK